MHLSRFEVYALVGAAIAGLLVATYATLSHRLRDARRVGAIRARVRRAGLGEMRAPEWLETAGYELLGTQVSKSYEVTVDGKATTITVRADHLARRDGRTYVVEVKTGAKATRIDTSATRRQLLEYRTAFDVHGVLLLDADAGRIQSVQFPDPTSSPYPDARSGLVVAFTLGAALVGAVWGVLTLLSR